GMARFSDALLLLFLALLAAVSCAPTRHQDACAEVRSSSLDLNHFAKTASVKVRSYINIYKSDSDFQAVPLDERLKEPDVSKDKEPLPTENWNKTLLCRYTMDRLFSFSILTARVFAVAQTSELR
uniref:Uncharacterized protein n=1 Tax=Kryptolebias marmoratus TaxID=37003 RepID=A0A3Q3F3I8_KRYMA